MFQKNKTIGKILAGLGFLMQITMIAISSVIKPEMVTVAIFISFSGYIIIVVGCFFYAIGKGYKWPVGLIGLLSIIGYLIISFLPDKNRMPQ